MVTFGNGRFLSAAGAPYPTYLSTNGLGWTRHEGIPISYPFDVAAISNGFIAVKTGFSPPTTMLFSANGVAWELRYSNTNHFLTSIAQSDNEYVAAGGDDTGVGIVATSPDLAQWISKRVTTNGPIGAIAYGNRRFVAVTSVSSLVSSDGSNWTETPQGFNGKFPRRMRFANGNFLLLVDSGAYVSSDGEHWRMFLDGMATRDILYANGHYVCVGETSGFENRVIVSRDLKTWKVAVNVPEGFGHLGAIAFGYNRFIVTSQPALEGEADLFLEMLPPARQVRVWGTQGRRGGIESSTDFRNWRTLANFDGSADFVDLPVSTNASSVFLRATAPPP